MTKAEVCARIAEIGILPAARVSAEGDARFAAEIIYRSGIPVIEITMTVPGAIDVIAHVAKTLPDMVVGAGTVLMDVVEFTVKSGITAMPGAMTPSEAIAAWKAGGDFVKIFPCAQLAGPDYIRALEVPLPKIKLIATGGVNQQTAARFIASGAPVIGIGGELIPPEALRKKNEGWVSELTRRYLGLVKEGRALRDGGQQR
jgi:2-dehydro-3-deoxyphosphogluconate aldolase / (4S)-4-hydroxy-2-oxoglutarate aldolase